MRSILIAALMAAGPALAGDLVAKNKETGAELRLYESACSHAETLAILLPQWRERFKNAKVLDAKGNIEHYACWIDEQEQVAVLFPDGQVLRLNLSMFKDPSV